MMEVYAQRNRGAYEDYRFELYWNRLVPNKSPIYLGMKDGDIIRATCHDRVANFGGARD